MELLCNLLGKIQTSDWRDHQNSEFHETAHSGLDQVDPISVSRPEINFDRLPRACSILDGHLNANRVGLFHFASLGFNPECELVESRLQCVGQRSQPVPASTLHSEIQIFCRARIFCKTQFHRDSAFKVVSSEDAGLHRSVESATKGQK